MPLPLAPNPAETTLCGMMQHQSIPHALLFTGPSGTGRLEAALRLAKALNCLEPPPASTSPNALTDAICHQCRSCRKIESGNHPDIHAIAPDGTHIKIAQIRELCDTLLAKPLEARHRLIVIQDADRMNVQAANALLKVLEEPPMGTIFVLLALQPSELLPTIVSRCQVVRFTPLARETVAHALMTEHSLQEPVALALAAHCDANLQKALAIVQSKRGIEGWLSARNWLYENLPLPGRGDAAHALAFAEVLAKDRETALSGLDLLGHLLHDMLLVAINPMGMANGDLVETIANEARNYQTPRIVAMIETTRKARKRIEGNSVVRHTLEVMALELMAC